MRFAAEPAGKRVGPRTSVLVAGWDRERELLVAWPLERAWPLRRGSSLRVFETTLERARATGYAAEPRPGHPATAVLDLRLLPDYVRNVRAGRDWYPSAVERARSELLGMPPLRGLRYALRTPMLKRAPDAPRRRDQRVRTGFASPDAPARALPRNRPLPRSTVVLMWFGIGVPRPGAIDTAPVTLPDLPSGSRLVVRLFPFERELEPVGATHGELRMDPDGRWRVVRPAADPGDVADAGRVLYFAVRTPEEAGAARLRCNVYLGATLIQSHLIAAAVGDDPDSVVQPALRATLDYRLADDLTAERLRQVPAHRLSLMVNGSGGSHQLRVVGLDGQRLFEGNASLDGVGLQASIDDARGALMRAAWGAEREWSGKLESYRYARRASIEQLADDLTLLAIRGRRLYVPIARELAGGTDSRDELERVAAARTQIQIASASSGLYVPAALFYDHPLDDLADVSKRYALCDALHAALAGEAPLEQLECLHDGCRQREQERVVCISGFWGFRHDLGWPLSAPAPLTEIESGSPAELIVGVSTDPGLTLRDAHVARLRALASCEIVDSRDAFTTALKRAVRDGEASPDVIYLYCHGGVRPPDTPYVEIGAPGSDGITEVYLSNTRARFRDTRRRPIAFINGCHTTALEPRRVMSLVNGFVQETQVVGVIGTELTVFEPLATTFAEAVLEAYLAGETIGAAVRLARLRLLGQRNPLGLGYVPFVAAPTRLVGTQEIVRRP